MLTLIFQKVILRIIEIARKTTQRKTFQNNRRLFPMIVHERKPKWYRFGE